MSSNGFSVVQDNPWVPLKHVQRSSTAVKRMLRANKFIIDRANIRGVFYWTTAAEIATRDEEAKNKKRAGQNFWRGSLIKLYSNELWHISGLKSPMKILKSQRDWPPPLNNKLIGLNRIESVLLIPLFRCWSSSVVLLLLSTMSTLS